MDFNPGSRKESEMEERGMYLKDLLEKAGYPAPYSPAHFDPFIKGVTDNSRNVKPGYIFVAIKGEKVDGHVYLSNAVEKKAAALVVQRNNCEWPGIITIRVPDTREAIARLAHAFYDFPSRECFTLGITGTNGKTSTAYLVRACLQADQKKTAIIGTIAHQVGNRKIKAVNTTPSALELAKMYDQMRDEGIRNVVMEVSSHAICQKRILGVKFSVGLFTHLSQDHLDYHGTMEEYRKAKERFFTEYLSENKEAVAVFNMDDEAGRSFSEKFTGEKISYGIQNKADVHTVNYDLSENGIRLEIDVRGEKIVVQSPLLGVFNVQNVTAAVAGAVAAGISKDAIVKGIASMKNVPGRFERIHEGQNYSVIVDYAHTPDALVRLLESVEDFTGERIITVFGCGGDRDKSKRPLMAEAVANSMKRNDGDYAIITNDNPRSEEPGEIASQVEAGMKKILGNNKRWEIVLDREEAIKKAIKMAGKGDVVIIAGKGHETYQVIGEETRHFDDREMARNVLKTL